jgi:hypothetical protein
VDRLKEFKYRGKIYEIRKSTRKGKQLMVNVNGKIIHFGDPDMPEFPFTERGDRYCTRSFGIKGRNDIESPNFWSRKFLWKCIGKKSRRR